ncbi:MAG: hypothetical protein EA425_05450 [Puniceicoccaceae bacterium]|nr:MAG: hypothetical protein EA425_05450 [Puniceicoccaceae bacterium]
MKTSKWTGKAKWIIPALLLSFGLVMAHGRADLRENAVWVDGRLYDTVVAPAFFADPPEHSTDPIYSFGMSGLTGQRSIAGDAPGYPGYNGGRWAVSLVIFTEAGLAYFDPEMTGVIDMEIESVMELFAAKAMGLVTIVDTDIYFSCPLLPRGPHRR